MDAKSYQIEHFEPKIEILLEHIEFWIFEKFDCGREENFIQPIMVSKKIGFQRDYKIMRGPLYFQNGYFFILSTHTQNVYFRNPSILDLYSPKNMQCLFSNRKIETLGTSWEICSFKNFWIRLAVCSNEIFDLLLIEKVKMFLIRGFNYYSDFLVGSQK